MITFRMGRAPKDASVQTGRRSPGIKRFTITKGTEVFKILFRKEDVHVSRSGRMHLDIWGQKLEDLRNVICSADREVKKNHAS
jgi:hypothetical protein